MKYLTITCVEKNIRKLKCEIEKYLKIQNQNFRKKKIEKMRYHKIIKYIILWVVLKLSNIRYCQTSNISHTLVSNKTVDHSDVVGASPVSAAPTTSSFLTEHLTSMDCTKDNCKARQETFKFWDLCVSYIRDLMILYQNHAQGLHFVVFCCGLVSMNFNTLRPRQMDAIFQTTFSNTFSWMKMNEFRLKFHWSLFPRVKLTTFHHWFR